MNCELAAFL